MPTVRTTTVNVATLAARTVTRRGVAPRVARICPVAYSEVIISTPRTPTAICARNSPLRLKDVGSKRRRWAGVSVSQLFTWETPTRMPKPIVTPTVTTSVHIVDRTERILVHSARVTARRTRRDEGGRRQLTAAPSAVVAVAVMLLLLGSWW